MLILTQAWDTSVHEDKFPNYTLETYPKNQYEHKEITSKLELFQALQELSLLPEKIYLTSKRGTKCLASILQQIPNTHSLVRITNDITLKTCLCFGETLSSELEAETIESFSDVLLNYGEALWTVCDFFDNDITYAIRPLEKDSRVKVFSVYEDYLVDELCPTFYYKTLSAVDPDRVCLGFIENPLPEEKNLFLNTWKLYSIKTTNLHTEEWRVDWAFGIYNKISGDLEFFSPYYFASRVCYVPYSLKDTDNTIEIQEECTFREVVMDLFISSWNEYYSLAINNYSFLLTFSTAFPSWCALVNLEEGEKLFAKLFYRFAKQYCKEYHKAVKSGKFRKYKALAKTEKVPEDFSVLAYMLKNTILSTFFYHLKLFFLERKLFS